MAKIKRLMNASKYLLLLLVSLLLVQCGPSMKDAKGKMKAGDIDGAVELLIELAENGNDKAVDELARYCLEIEDTPKVGLSAESKHAALPWLETRAESWENGDLANLISIYYYFDDDEKNVMKWKKIAAQKGNNFCASVVGRHLMEIREYEQAIPYLIQGTKEESVAGEAYYNLADIYYAKDFAGKDNDKAFDFLIKAAEHGSPKAKYLMSIRYATGDGVPEDIERAYKYITSIDEDYILDKERPAQIKRIYEADKNTREAKANLDKAEQMSKTLSPGTCLVCSKGTGTDNPQSITFKKNMTLRFEAKVKGQPFAVSLKYYINTNSLDNLEPKLKFLSVTEAKNIKQGDANEIFKDSYIQLSFNPDGKITVSGLKVMSGIYNRTK